MKQFNETLFDKRYLLMIGLVIVFSFPGASSVAGQEICTSAKEVPANVSDAESSKIARCWKDRLQTGFQRHENAYLVGANLSKMNLSGYDFRNADMRGVGLDHANLTAAMLNGANLSGGSDLSDAILDRANIKGANLTDAIFERATMTFGL